MNSMRNRILFLICFLLGGLQAFAQISLSGRVTDATNSGMPGVSVAIKGTTVGTITDNDGSYRLNVPKTAKTAVFSFVGYRTQEVQIGGKRVINVTLSEDSKQLDEVVVVAYGTQKRKDLTGSLSTVDSKIIGTQSVSTVSKALEGQIPGLQVSSVDGQPGRDMAIRVRGVGSTNLGSSGALIVIDGVPQDSGTYSTENPLASINPDDIETATVLKDAASTALYGSRGANGVILITTKTGKAGKTKISFRGRWGVNSVGPFNIDAINSPSKYYEWAWKSIYNSYMYGVNGTGLPQNWTTNVNSPNHSASDGALFASQHLFNYTGSESTFTRNNLGNFMSYNVPNAVYTADGTSDSHSATMTGAYLVNPDGKINPNAKLLYNNSYEDYLLQNNFRQEYDVSASGGTDKLNYYMSLNYLEDPSYIKNSKFARYSGRATVNSQVTNWLYAGSNVSFNRTTTQTMSTTYGRNPGSNQGNVFRFINGTSPIVPVFAYNQDGSYRYNTTTGTKNFFLAGTSSDASAGTYSPFGYTTGNYQATDILYEMDHDYMGWVQDKLTTRTFAEASFLDGFKFKVNLGFDRTLAKKQTYFNSKTGRAKGVGGLGINDYNSTNLDLLEMLTYTKDFGKHHIDAMGSHEYTELKYYNLGWGSSYELIPGLMKAGNFVGRYTQPAGVTGPSYSTYTSRLESYMGRLNYVYDDKYYASASIRRDGTSKFYNTNHQWGTFWSVGGGWRISAEKFMETTKGWLDNAKVRASYGVIGNANALGIYADQTTWGYGATYTSTTGGTGTPASYTLSVGGFVNDALTWENTRTFDCGIDLSFLNRINLTIDYYNRYTNNSFYNQPVSYLATGQSTLQSNSAGIRNRGYEIELSADVIRTKDWTVNLATNGTHYTTVLKSLGNYTIPSNTNLPTGTYEANCEGWGDAGAGNAAAGALYLRGIGRDWYNLWIYKYMGVDQTTGLPLYGHKVTTDDVAAGTYAGKKAGQTVGVTNYNLASKYEEGSALPKWVGGFTATVKYKDFDLQTVLAYQLGGKFYSVEYGNGLYMGSLLPNQNRVANKMVNNTWTPTSKGAYFPMQWYGSSSNYYNGATFGSWLYTDMALFSASYLRVKNITLGYNLPKSIVSKAGIGNCRVFVSGDNLFFLSAAPGIDPSMSLTGGMEVGAYMYPTIRTISVGINIDL